MGHFLELLRPARNQIVTLQVDLERALSFHTLLSGVRMPQDADLFFNEGANLVLQDVLTNGIKPSALDPELCPAQLRLLVVLNMPEEHVLVILPSQSSDILLGVLLWIR